MSLLLAEIHSPVGIFHGKLLKNHETHEYCREVMAERMQTNMDYFVMYGASAEEIYVPAEIIKNSIIKYTIKD